MAYKLPQLQDIQQAHNRIKHLVHNTPILTSKAINKKAGAQIFFKCENFQKVGAFKFRGASNAVSLLTGADLQKGVATHSSGNHAAALSLAAQKMNIPAYIVMPETAPEIKKKAVAGYGANITFCKPTLQAREETLHLIQQKTGASFIHPYDHFDVVCGQGTATLELLHEVSVLDAVVAPIGGGGLMSGTATVAKAINSNMMVVGSRATIGRRCLSFV